MILWFFGLFRWSTIFFLERRATVWANRKILHSESSWPERSKTSFTDILLYTACHLNPDMPMSWSNTYQNP